MTRLLQGQRAQPDGVDGNIEMKLATTTASDDAELLIDTDNSWMSSLPEVSTLDYSPQASAVEVTFGTYSGKQIQSALSAMEDDNAPADVNENDMPPPPDI